MNQKLPENFTLPPSSHPLQDEDKASGEEPKGLRARHVAAIVLVFAGLLGVGLVPRLHEQRALLSAAQARQEAQPIVNIVNVRRAAAEQEFILPGNTQAFRETAIYARTNGYLKQWFVDIGDHVAVGQLLAVIETPEIDQELAQARAALTQSQANLLQVRANAELAQSTLQRFKTVKPEAISRQQIDEQENVLKTARAAVEVGQANIKANEANVKRLLELQSFQKVTAPFAGVITARNVDPGALISAGSSPTSRELFHLVQTSPLRIFVNVPQSFAPSIQLEQNADVAVQEYSQRTFQGMVTRTAGALDPASRTLLTEVQTPNTDNALLPGMYVQVHFVFKRNTPPVLVPASAILTSAAGAQVAVVDADDTVHYRKVQVGKDYGAEVELLTGLTGEETIVMNASWDLAEGVHVQRKTSGEAPKAPGGKS